MNRASLVLVSMLALAGCDDPTEGVATATVSAAEPTAAPAEPTAAGSTAAPAARETLTIDRASSSVGFTGSKVTGSHDGTFSDFAGTMELDPAHVTASSVSVTIQMGSLAIEPERLAGHLRTGDFFLVEQFPTATFASTAIAEGATGTVGDQPATHTITGNLTMRGQTRAISFPAVVSVTPSEVSARSEFTINRHDFGIEYAGMPDDLINDAVVIRFAVRAPRS